MYTYILSPRKYLVDLRYNYIEELIPKSSDQILQGLLCIDFLLM